MKVIVAGFAKTGITTLKEALKILGYNVYGMPENSVLLGNDWKNILENGPNKQIFLKMYKDVDVVCDLPACYYWEELLEAFPDSKIIFMERKDEEWLKSWKDQVSMLNESWIFNTVNMIISKSARSLIEIDHLIGRVVFGEKANWGGKLYTGISDSMLLRRYHDHNTAVKEKCPSDQICMYNTKSGWDPLCSFLNLKIPDQEFPSPTSVKQNSSFSHPLYQKIHEEVYSSFVKLTMGVAILMGLVNAYMIMFL